MNSPMLVCLVFLSIVISTNAMQDSSSSDGSKSGDFISIKLSPRISKKESLKQMPKVQAIKDMTEQEEKMFHKNREVSSPQTLLRRESANRINVQKQRVG